MSLKLLGKNSAIYAIGNVGARAAAFLLIPLYTHALTIADFVLLATCQATIQIMAILTSCGMRTTLLRFAKEYDRQDRLGTLVGTSVLLNVLGGVAVSAGALTFFVPVFRHVLHISDVYPYVALVCGAALAQALSAHMTSYYRAQQQAIKYMISGIMTAVLLFAVTYILVCVRGLGVAGALVAFILTHAAIVLVVSLDVLRQTSLGISWSLMPRLLHFGFPLVFSMSSELTIGAAGIYFLSCFAGLEAVAIYSLGLKLAQILGITTISPFALAFEPYVYANLHRSDQKEQIARSVTYVILAATFMSFCIIAGTHVLLPHIAPPEYASAFVVVLLLLPGMAFTGVYYFGETLLNAMQKTRTTGSIATVVAGLSVGLNYGLVRHLSWYGAAISLDLSFIVMGLALAAIGIKHFSITLEWKRIGVLAALLLAFLVACLALRDLPTFRFAIISILLGTLGLLLLIHCGFFGDREKLMARQLMARLTLRGIHEDIGATL